MKTSNWTTLAKSQTIWSESKDIWPKVFSLQEFVWICFDEFKTYDGYSN